MFSKKFLPAYFLTFVNTLGFSILIPVLPFIVKDIYNAPEFVYGLILSLYAFFQFIGAPYLGSLSDRIGRKPVLVISQIGTLLSWFIFIIAYFLPTEPVILLALPLWVIIIARIFDGITGGNISVTNAYISDITTPKEKSTIFGYLGGIAGLGIIIGPGIGGLASSGSIGYLGAVLIAFVISLITTFSIIFWLNESNKNIGEAKKEKFSLSKTLLVTKRIKTLNASYVINKIFLLRFVMGLIMASYIATIPLFVVDLFGFDQKQLGFFMLFVGMYLALNQAFAYKYIVSKLGEIKTMFLGFCLMMIGFYCITLEVNIYLYLALYYILNLGFSLVLPVFNSIISQKGEPTKQGEAMGISESIASICMATFPVLAALLYAQIGLYIYYILALVPLVALYIIYKIIQHEK